MANCLDNYYDFSDFVIIVFLMHNEPASLNGGKDITEMSRDDIECSKTGSVN